MNVLSLFDGMSCGQIALNRAGIPYDNYFASEVDKHAIKVTQHNYPNTIQLGDVALWDTWNINWGGINLLLGGSPCQGFSFAGKQLNFDDPRSKLFFTYVDILSLIKVLNPSIKFLLENVKMKKQYQDIITAHLGVEPICINSALLSAQNRHRNYWTNIENIVQPGDKNITFRQICDLDHNTFKYIPEHKTVGRDYKLNYVQYDIKGKGYGSQDQRAYYMEGKHGCLDTGANGKSKIMEDDGRIRHLTRNEVERLQTVPDNYTNSVSEPQAKRMLGNGWTVDVIVHILSKLCPYNTHSANILAQNIDIALDE